MQLEDGWNSQGFVIGGVLDGAVEKWLKSHKGIDSKATCCHAICSTGTGMAAEPGSGLKQGTEISRGYQHNPGIRAPGRVYL